MWDPWQLSDGIGKGSYWCVDPNFRPNLLQALRRTPYHPYHQMQMVSNGAHGMNGAGIHQQITSMKHGFNEPSPHLFPFLSKRLSQTKFTDSSDIDVANTLVLMKRSAESRRRPLHCRNEMADDCSRSPSPPEFGSENDKKFLRLKLRASKCHLPVVCTSNPSPDHTYSLTSDQLDDASHSSIDDECILSDIEDVDEEGISECDDDDVEDDDDDDDDTDDEEDPSVEAGREEMDDDGVEKMVIEMLVCKKEASDNDAGALPPRKGMTTRSMTSRRHVKSDDEDEKQKRFEGVNALLNLSRIGSLLHQSPGKAAKKARRDDVCSNNNNNNNNCVKVRDDLNCVTMTSVKEEPMDDS